MITATKKWIFTKISSIILIPFLIWFLIKFVGIYGEEPEQIILFFSSQLNKLLFSIFIVAFYFFSALTISEIFEDYLKDSKIKNVANKILYLFSIIIPLITILILNNLRI